MTNLEFGDYYIQERTAIGGMANLYLAKNRDGLLVALRALQPQFLKNRVQVRQFCFGCKVLSNLNHASIPKYFIHGKRDDGLPWVAMEYVPSPNLREKLHLSAELLWNQHLSLLLSMAMGLSHIHERGYLHMDFKPENLLVWPSGQAKIIDFDLAVRRPLRLTRLPLAGTAIYMAPELLLRQPTDERADIFSFGVTAFELLTGRKAFGSGTTQEMFNRAKIGADFETPPSTLDFNPKVSPKLDHIIRGCLAKNLKDRYPVMSLVARDLQALT